MSTAGKKAAATRKRREAAKKGAQTRRRRLAGQKAAATRKGRNAATKAAVTRKSHQAGTRRTSGSEIIPRPAPEQVIEHLRRLEESLLQPDVRKSKELIALLADEFIEFAHSGRAYTKQDLVNALQAQSPSVQITSNFQVRLLGPEVALLTYMICREAAQPVYTLRSSVWQQRADKWLMVFHQATVTSGATAVPGAGS